MGHPAIMGVIGGVMMVAGVGSVALGLNEPMRNDVNYRLFSVRPNTKLQANDLSVLKRRNRIEEENYNTDLLELGYSEGRREQVYELSRQMLVAYEYVSAMRRGELSVEEARLKINQLGFEDDDINTMIKVSEPIPTTSDIIAFAVREVYSPEIAERFGQYEGADEVFKEAKRDIDAIGLSQETFNKYWAAHWFLPSMQQGFEMLHRGVINQEDLFRLMVALDIMPFWRDKLEAISYHPYTRVDVRRMHKYGVLKDEDLLRAYKDVGFDEEKAQNMADWTILYNYDPSEEYRTEEEARAQHEKDLTKSDITGAYRDKVISREEAAFGLYWIGYDEDESAIILDRIDYRELKSMEDDIIEIHHKAFVNSIIGYDDVVVKLNELALPSARVEKLLATWLIERDARTQRPTKSELLAFLKAKIIEEETFKEEMRGLHYTERYIDWYLTKLKQAEAS